MNDNVIKNQEIQFLDWGKIKYNKAWHSQREMFDENVSLKSQKKRSFNKFVFCEHYPVITLGKSGHRDNLLINTSILEKKNIEYVEIDRGGDITFHGPGQIVGYPIFDLDNFDMGLKKYVWTIEQIIINVLLTYDIKAERSIGASGVWLDVGTPKERKICALGIKSSRFVTMHGFAFNVTTDLSNFSLINPCGFINKGVTSMEKELGYAPDINEVKKRIKEQVSTLFVQPLH
ncbi:MAG: lipoyl(octanoyl) transferase LipB [Bacteroidales bacterium]|nr:lipoyl(octanoyl) transferase LipB [Bacteroidales bacterium]